MRLGCIDCSIRSPHLSFVWISPIAGILIDVNYPDSFLVFRTITAKHYLPSLNRLSSPLSDQTMGYFSHAHDHCSLFVAGEWVHRATNGLYNIAPRSNTIIQMWIVMGWRPFLAL